METKPGDMFLVKWTSDLWPSPDTENVTFDSSNLYEHDLVMVIATSDEWDIVSSGDAKYEQYFVAGPNLKIGWVYSIHLQKIND